MESRTLLKVAPGEGQLELARRVFTEPPTGQVLIKIRRAAICGTDLHIYHWNDWAARNYTLQLVLGHEFCGEVLAIGLFVLRNRVTTLFEHFVDDSDDRGVVKRDPLIDLAPIKNRLFWPACAIAILLGILTALAGIMVWGMLR